MNKSLTRKQRLYVEHRARGMGRERSAILAGYKGIEADHGNIKRVESNPSVQDALAKIRAEMANAAGVSKEDIVAMLIDAAALSKLQADPTALVAAARELGKMLGYYAPEVKKTLHGVDKTDLKKALRDMRDEDLYRLAFGEPIEGESKRITEVKDAGPQDVPPVQGA